MKHEPVLAADAGAPPRPAAAWRRDLLVALLLATLLSAAWTLNDWGNIAFLTLPDNDDMMRLAQIRDLVAGQGFNDWTQYRLAPPEGGPMHWSRLDDVVPAGIILALRPLAGTYLAELAAVIAWPALLFVGYLFLCARIARRLVGAEAALPALVVAAIAYPANSLFLPGRIDHHALQIVLVLGAILALVRAPSWGAGLLLGACAALSFGVGLETAPQVAALMAVQCGLWLWRGDAERARMLGFAAALGGITAALLAVARPSYWSDAWCDAFTPASATGALAAAGLFAALGLAGRLLTGPTARTLAAGIGGVVALGALLARFPVCLTGPYGPMDPLVRRAFMDNVIEAQGLLQSPSLAYGWMCAGLMAVGTAVLAWTAWRRPEARVALLPIAAVLLASDVILFAQVRGGYIGSAVVAPLLGGMIVAARAAPRHRTAKLIAAWAVSAGMLHLTVPERLQRIAEPATRAAFLAHRSCKTGDVWHQIDRYPTGTVMTSIDMGAHVIGGSRHGSVAAGYHRSNRGNRAMYDFFLADPTRARAIAADWSVDYVAVCPTDFGELDVQRRFPGSVAAMLTAGRAPAWLERIPLRDTGLRFYRLRE